MTQTHSHPQTNRFLTLPGGTVNTEIGQPFDPEAGTTVFAPRGEGSGWWVGAPSAWYDGEFWYLSFRTRMPQPVRGGIFQIAKSADGVNFEVIGTFTKEAIGTSSIERGALLQTDNGTWRLYLSYVDPVDSRWRTDLFEAPSAEALADATAIPVLSAADINAEGIKDPWVCQVDGLWHMIVSWAPTPDGISSDQMHGTRDIYNTGTSKSLTGLLTSNDGLSWDWHGTILEPSADGWDEYAARINTVYVQNNQFIGLYDGSKSVAENYEERCGAAVSTDLRTWTKVSTDGPIVGPNGGPGSVRYAEALQTETGTRFYYEYTRADGSHELRTIEVPRG